MCVCERFQFNECVLKQYTNSQIPDPLPAYCAIYNGWATHVSHLYTYVLLVALNWVTS